MVKNGRYIIINQLFMFPENAKKAVQLCSLTTCFSLKGVKEKIPLHADNQHFAHPDVFAG